MSSVQFQPILKDVKDFTRAWVGGMTGVLVGNIVGAYFQYDAKCQMIVSTSLFLVGCRAMICKNSR